ncbi:MAG: hypothetical protein CL840_17115 [Crocinitomicaceae bacterium]|nr:hypothetical protein [Crocinitomicaceae bacterium]
MKDTSEYDSIIYHYGDPSSGLLNSSRNRLDSHIYKTPGTYNVTAIGYFYYKGKMIIDTLSQTIKVDDIPRFSLPNDTIICQQSLKIDLPKSKEYSYLWYNGSKKSSTINKSSAKVWAQVSNICGTSSDTMILQIDKPAKVNLGRDTLVCKGTRLKLNVGSTSSYNYLWSNGSKDSVIVVSGGGIHWVKVSNSCSSDSDSIRVRAINAPELDLPNQIHSCTNNPKDITGLNRYVDRFLWSNGDTTSKIRVTKEGWYKCKASNRCKTVEDSVYVRIDYPQHFTLGPDSFICDQETIELRPQLIGSFDTVYWNANPISDTVLIVTTSGLYKLTTVNSCGTYSDEVWIDHLLAPSVYLGKDTILCEGELATFTRHKPKSDNYNQYTWSGIESGNELTVLSEGKYWMEQKNPCGTSSDTIDVKVVSNPYFGIRDTFKCEEENLIFDYSEYTELSFTWNKTETEYIHTIYDFEDQLLWIKNGLGCLGVERFGIDRCPNPLYIPNAFSPNSDGLNETFMVIKNDISFYEIEIIDRWNKVVYHSNNIEEGWDGSVLNNGENICPTGMYVWRIQFQEYEKDFRETVLGEVQLLR